MIDNHVSLPEAIGPDEETMSYSDGSSGERNRAARAYPSAARNDREILARLLKLGLGSALTEEQELTLDVNEELPRLIPILCAYFSREELIDLVGEKLTAKMLELHRIEVLQNLFLERELQRVLHAFNKAKIPLMLFKGPALAHTIYPKPHLRTYHDIDVLISPHDLAQAHDLLTQMGFTFYEEYRSNVINSKRTGYNYILKRADSWLEVLVELHTAPHPSEIGTTFDLEALWAQARPITVLGEQTLTMDPGDHLLYLCWHYRFHAFTRLSWLYDLVVMLRSMEFELNWITVVQMARKQRLAATLYFCLSWCRDLFNVPIPEWVFAQLRPPFICRVIIERIALPDVARALAAEGEQFRRVLAHRTMVDSVGELLHAGLRTLFPTPAAIGLRYMNHSRLPLQLYSLYYLIHPWITVAKGVRYLVKKWLDPGKSA